MNMLNKISASEIEDLLRSNLTVKNLAVTDLKGGDHWQVDIVASNFNGLNTMKKHRLVYKILAEALESGAIHALIINSKGEDE